MTSHKNLQLLQSSQFWLLAKLLKKKDFGNFDTRPCPAPSDHHGNRTDTQPFQDEAGEALREEPRDGGWSQEGDPEEFGG